VALAGPANTTKRSPRYLADILAEHNPASLYTKEPSFRISDSPERISYIEITDVLERLLTGLSDLLLHLDLSVFYCS